MIENKKADFKKAYEEYLETLSISCLRLVGRRVGVRKSTVQKKGELIGNIVNVLVGEVPPATQSNRGAPVKDDYIDPVVFEKLEEIKLFFLSDDEEKIAFKGNDDPFAYGRAMLGVRDIDGEKNEGDDYEREVYCGQTVMVNGVACLFPLSGNSFEADFDKNLVLPASILQSYSIREGDVITCYAKLRHSALVAEKVLTINGELAEGFDRFAFDAAPACYSARRIDFVGEDEEARGGLKYFDWLLPFGAGQRGLIASETAKGKSYFLREIAKAAKEVAVKNNPELRVLVFSVDDMPEDISEWKNILSSSELVCSTFDDDAEKHAFAAEFVLNRAKCFAETGKDVLLLVDSFTALYNALSGTEQEKSRYIQKFFAAARCLKEKGSLAILGTINTENPSLANELLREANFGVFLNSEMADCGIYPAVDLAKSFVRRSDLLLDEEGRKTADFIRKEYLPRFGNIALAQAIAASSSAKQLFENISGAKTKLGDAKK